MIDDAADVVRACEGAGEVREGVCDDNDDDRSNVARSCNDDEHMKQSVY